jgi:RnfABCDGE-type electron transport complex B subunit
MQILIPLLLFAAMGLIAGVLLTVASTYFAVKSDPRKEQIIEALPGANCGGCGFAGCADYADAIVKGKAEPNLCKPGGADTTIRIGEIIGKAAVAAEPEVMVLHCAGTCNATGRLYE